MEGVAPVSPEAPGIDVLGRFESLGDNCEFGFVQRQLGLESGGLFRWSVTSATSLITLLETRFEDLYRFENLVPTNSKNMIRDTATDIGFHTEMSVTGGSFDQDEETRRAIYAKERLKIDYLIEKMISRLEDPQTIFVQKAQWGIDERDIRRLITQLRRYSKCSLLHVSVSAQKELWGTIEQPEPGVMLGYLDRFAPWSQADHVSLDHWKSLIKEAATQITP